MTLNGLHVITCKAAVVKEVGGAIAMEEIRVDPPKGRKLGSRCCVRVFVILTSYVATGYLLMVESIGEDVGTRVKPGDVVMPLYLGECGQCLNCKSGKTNICHVYPISFDGLMRDGTSRISIASTGEPVYHHFSCSTWSEYTVIDVNYLIKVDPRVPLAHASFLSCGFTTGLGAPWKEVAVSKGSSVAVFGLGVVGLGVIKGAQMQGASTIIGIDINEKKAAIGEVFGMTDFINPQNHPNKPVSDLVKDMTNGLGVDYSFECSGVTPLLNEALEASKIGIGSTVAIGVGLETNWAIRNTTLISGRTLKGSLMGGVKTQSDLPVILDKCINKELEVDKLLTHEIKLENIKEAFEILKKHECLKILINF